MVQLLTVKSVDKKQKLLCSSFMQHLVLIGIALWYKMQHQRLQFNLRKLQQSNKQCLVQAVGMEADFRPTTEDDVVEENVIESDSDLTD